MPGKYKSPPSGNLSKIGKRLLLSEYESIRSNQPKPKNKEEEQRQKRIAAALSWNYLRSKGYTNKSYANTTI